MIERMRLRNFRRYRDADVTFQPGVNFIEGVNNAGKTSLFYAIEYVFLNRVEGFRSIRSLMQPGKRSLGVEVVFIGRDNNRYLLQRMHQLPARSKKTMEGHFTLKQLVEDGEQYILASDFGDTEDKLAMKLRELTGVTRRLFTIALHMRQGEIAAVLDGAKQLDIVLGVTAAAMAEEELRHAALEMEKESAGLAVLEERLRAIGNELVGVNTETKHLTAERKVTATKLAATGASDPRLELDRRLAPLLKALVAYDGCQQKSELAKGRLADEQERRDAAVKSGSDEDLAKELAALEADGASRAETLPQLRAQLDDIASEQRRLDQQRGDLAGRIARRRNLPTGEGATCEACGAPINPAHTAEELAKWTAEIEQLEKIIDEVTTRQKKTQSSLTDENEKERKRLGRVSEITRQRERLGELVANLTKRQKEYESAVAAEQTAQSAIGVEVKTLNEPTLVAAWQGDSAVLRNAIGALQQSLAEKAGRQVAERQALTDLLQRFDVQLQGLTRRNAELEREQTATSAEANIQRTKAARAKRFRGISAAFKQMQVTVRSNAATRLATDTLRLHRHLSERDEFEALTIDPSDYSVQVKPHELGEEVPAGLYEGGGHRLLLGLSFRLAVAMLVSHCPFLMLDEPTYGLDAAHRETLLHRIAGLDVSKQILLVTHQAMGDLPGHRIKVVRQGRETVVEGSGT